MNTMTIQQFCSANTEQLAAFQDHWFANVYPNLDEESANFWDYSAKLWDWVDQYEIWELGR